MKAKDIINIKPTDYGNIFTVEKDEENNTYYYNLHNNIIFDETPDPETYIKYKPKGSDSWASLSNHYYGSTDLWWFILRFNNIKNPLLEPTKYQNLKIPKDYFVHRVLNVIS